MFLSVLFTIIILLTTYGFLFHYSLLKICTKLFYFSDWLFLLLRIIHRIFYSTYASICWLRFLTEVVIELVQTILISEGLQKQTGNITRLDSSIKTERNSHVYVGVLQDDLPIGWIFSNTNNFVPSMLTRSSGCTVQTTLLMASLIYILWNRDMSVLLFPRD